MTGRRRSPRKISRPDRSSTRRGDALRKAQASLTLQRAIYDRDKAGPTVEERASADAKVALADAAAANLAAKLAKTTLVAPVDGRVSLLVAEPGEVISPGQSDHDARGRARALVHLHDPRGSSWRHRRSASPLWLRTAKGDRIAARVTELRPLGEFAVWRAARAVGDHDLNSFLAARRPCGGNARARAGHDGVDRSRGRRWRREAVASCSANGGHSASVARRHVVAARQEIGAIEFPQ